MRLTFENISMSRPFNPVRNERGLSLLEVLLSTVVLGVALTGFLMALLTASTTTKIATDENQLVYLAGLEFENLRATEYGRIPFAAGSTPGYLEEVPDYFNDLGISSNKGGDCLIVASGDLSVVSGDLSVPGTIYSRDNAFDGKRANDNLKWIGAVNALAYQAPTGPGAGGPGGGGPSAGGPGGGPEAGGDYAPPNYQFIYCAFPQLTKISRILFDNRFNVTELNGSTVEPLSAGNFDFLPHDKDVWERNFDFFWNDTVLKSDQVYIPWNSPPLPLQFTKDLGYASSGVQLIFDNPDQPLAAGIVGLHNIDTYSDFDQAFHWPYVSEIEIYGYSEAANFVESYQPSAGYTQYDNVVMYFPDYLNSGFDLGRRVYVDAPSLDEAKVGHCDLMHAVIEFYPSSRANLNEAWQKETWWQRDTNELARFETSFYRDVPTRIDRLPNLHDLPVHVVYGDNEDLLFPFSVPGATSIRAYFSKFDLGPSGADRLKIEDQAGNIYFDSYIDTLILGTPTPWVDGDTIVMHFISDGSGNTYDNGYGGFEVSQIEVSSVSTE
jgi:type II secretory pathway pseudopilin PulG